MEVILLKFGLIGCGRIGSMHANILHQEDDVILESVFDINKNFAKAVSNKTGAKVCNQDAACLVSQFGLSAAFVVTPFLPFLLWPK